MIIIQCSMVPRGGLQEAGEPWCDISGKDEGHAVWVFEAVNSGSPAHWRSLLVFIFHQADGTAVSCFVSQNLETLRDNKNLPENGEDVIKNCAGVAYLGEYHLQLL